MGENDLHLPDWAERLKDGYLSGEASQFLIHSNVGDVVRWECGGQVEYIPLIEFITRFLSRTKEIVAFYNLSEGVCFAKREMRDLFVSRIVTQRRVKGEPEWSGVIPSSPSQVLKLLGEFVTIRSSRAAVIINYLETLVPEGDMGYLGSEDRASLVAIQEWSRAPSLLGSDNIVVLVAENIMEVNHKIRSTPQLMSIEVGLPDRQRRLDFINHLSGKYSVSDLSPGLLADMTAGMSCIQIEALFKNAEESGRRVTLEGVVVKKKEVIERECMGLVEVLDPGHGFESIGGMDQIKKLLGGVAEAIKKGERRRAPMGILLVGPMGTGKTFLAEAFARESGMTCIKLKNFREKWVGSTEANLEKILSIVQALGHVLVIVDEADRNLGSEGRDSDGGTESRVIARLKEFMSDGRHRGRIVFMVLTNRPDKLDVDLKRPGRLDLKAPIFYPETPAERKEILEAVSRKNGFVVEKADLEAVAKKTDGFSGADLEGVLVSADRLASEDGREEIGDRHIEAALSDFIPTRNSAYVEYMELLSAFEASSRRLLPDRYRSLTNEEMQERMRVLRSRLGI